MGRKRNDDTWNAFYEEFKIYYKQNGNVNTS